MGFSEFYELYPRKQAKIDAEKAWKSMKCEAISEKVIAGLKKQLPYWTDPKFIPLPASFLRAGRWTDEQHVAVRPAQGPAKPLQIHDPWKQHDAWKAMMNLWLLGIVRARGGVELDTLRNLVAERNRLADQCRQMWGETLPEVRDVEVLGGMLKRLEGVA